MNINTSELTYVDFLLLLYKSKDESRQTDERSHADMKDYQKRDFHRIEVSSFSVSFKIK